KDENCKSRIIIRLKNDSTEVVLSEENNDRIVTDLGETIKKDYEGKTPILVGLLKGSALFMGDLIKKIDTHLEIDFMDVSSYVGTKSTGEVQILKDLSGSVD